MHHHAYFTGVEDAKEKGHKRMLTKNSRPKVLHQSIAVRSASASLNVIPQQRQHCQKQAFNQPYDYKQTNFRVS